MKTLAASEADFRGHDREGNRVEDFWTVDVTGLYSLTAALRWERRDRREPDLIGREILTLNLTAPKAYEVPGPDVRTSYAMESPSRGEGARALDPRGRVVVEDVNGPEIRVTLDLRARMERIDRPGVQFDETVRGTYVLD